MADKGKGNPSAAQLGRSLPTTPKDFRKKDDSIKKVAVTSLEQDSSGSQQGLLIEFDQVGSWKNDGNKKVLEVGAVRVH